MTASTLDAALTRGGNSVRAVFPVHLNGQVAAPAAIAAFAHARQLAVVDDAAHALGTTYDCGAGAAITVGGTSHSDMTTFSFHPLKPITTGEGGAVTTDDDDLAARLRTLRNHGMQRDPDAFVNRDLAFDTDGSVNPWYYEMTEVGLNYRATDIQCALGLSQLGKLPRFTEIRTALADRYDALLAPLAPQVRPVPRITGCRSAWHLYVVSIDFAALGTTRGQVMKALHARGVGSQVHYMPLHLQPYYRERYGELSLPGAEAYYQRALTLPLFPEMTADDVSRVAAALREVLEGGA
jgi:dTDP-4-amino-4,6-dideoxygalactose transaminase